MKSWLAFVLVLLMAAGALALRLVELDRRPMHTDEAVHGVKFLQLWQYGGYRYDPHEYHGPSLYYLSLPSAWLSGARDAASVSEGTLRRSVVVAGVLLVVMVLLVRPAMGNGATLWAALFTAVSPAMVFYSRYFIHEMLLVVFTFFFLAATWRYLQAPKAEWALLAGLGLGLMYATKETFVLALAAAMGAALLTQVWGWLRDKHWPDAPWRVADVAACILAAAVVGVVLFASFGMNPGGPADSIRTYKPWFSRAEGQSPHIHPWHYYLELLLWAKRGGVAWTEAAIVLLGLAGMGVGFWRRELPWGSIGWVRFLSFYTLLMTVGYSALPYKTPWCELGFLHGWILLAGTGAAAATWWLTKAWQRWLAAGGIVLLAAHLGWQAWRAAVPLCDSQKNPFVYAHTLPSTLDLVEKVDELVRISPGGKRTVIRVMARGGDYWPLPWYFRGFKQVGWHASVPTSESETFASILIASPSFEPAIERVAGQRLTALGYFGLRPSVFLQLHVEKKLWEAHLARTSHPPTGN